MRHDTTQVGMDRSRGGRPAKIEVLGNRRDPYPRAASVRRTTRDRLAAFSARPGPAVCVLTRSSAVLDDLDLILALPRASVGIVLPSPDARLLRRLEPGYPDLRGRFSLLRRLSRAGVRTGLLLRPVFPGLGDRLGTMRRLAEKTAEAGGEWFRVRCLRLGADRALLAGVRDRYPGLAKMYALRFGPDGEPPRVWEERVLSMAASLRVDNNLAAGPFEPVGGGDRLKQLRLPFAGKTAREGYALTGTS